MKNFREQELSSLNNFEYPTNVDLEEIVAIDAAQFSEDQEKGVNLLTEETLKQLQELDNELIVVQHKDGKLAAFSVVIPTSLETMREFITTHSEKELITKALHEKSYEALYYLLIYSKRQGLRAAGLNLAEEHLRTMIATHPNMQVYAWTINDDGKKALEAIESKTGLGIIDASQKSRT